jgi:hypothetical protein
MQFTAQEMKMIERLRKQQRQWPRWRWVILAIGVLFTVDLFLYGNTLFALASQLQSERPASPDTVLAIAICFPKCLVQVAIAAWAYAKVITEWHGNVSRTILLRLLATRETENTDEQKSK